MNSYWLDSDVLVYAKDNFAPFGYADFAGFWSMLDRSIDQGFVKITKRNFQEITASRDSEDDLAKWLKLRKGFGVCVAPDKEVQGFATRIGEYVYGNDRFLARHRTRFSRGADAWLIAQAAMDCGVVVTREVSEPRSRDPKIPDLCKEFKVRCATLPEAMKELATLISKKGQPSSPLSRMRSPK